ncbi:MAG: polyprenyl synthetase family protein [Candidatus Lokiarchaeota archaeon]|nr:polyprenyl synthetase family protein [Candidatus Harpocratesius repetitus]
MNEQFLMILEKEREKINKKIDSIYRNLIEQEEETYLRKFHTYSYNFTKGPGRRILPICLVNIFLGLSGDRDIAEMIDEVYKISISVELLHISSLIIDDLIDKEEIRRGLPTFHKSILQLEKLPDLIENSSNISEEDKEKSQEFETSAAIYGGNITSLIGSRLILESNFDNARKEKSLQIYLSGLEGIIRGHLLDEHYKLKHLDQITLEDYLILSALKRGKPMETAVGIGAILGHARSSQLEPLMQAMNKIGIIDQLMNDVKGSFGDPKEKSISSDITSGQCTILTIIAYQSATSEQKEILNSTLGNRSASKEQIEAVREIFKSTGALEFVKMYSNSLKNDIYNLLQKVYPGLKAEIMKFFNDLLNYITDLPVFK